VTADPVGAPDETQAPEAPALRPVEVELKYRPATWAAGQRVLNAESIAGLGASRPPKRVRFEDRYVDTASGSLGGAGFAARLRATRGGTIVSLKGTARSGAGQLHRREELEAPADPVAPPQDWPPSDARDLVVELSRGEPLIELVTIRQVRHRRRLRDDGTVVEVSLDEVEVVAGDAVVDRWLELEIELVRGDEARLTAVAEELERDPELQPGGMSKLEAARSAIAAAQAGGERASPADPARPQKIAVPKTPGVTGDDTVAEAGRKTIRFHFARMLAREAGTRAGTDLEDLHGMRVATRRMRAAWRIFGSGFRTNRTKRLRARLRTVASRLGGVRDLDVQLEALESYRAQVPPADQRSLQPLADAWHRQRDGAREELLRELDSPGYARFVEELRAFANTEGAAAAEAAATDPHHVRDTAPSRIWAAYEQVRAYEPVLRWADVETLHELRIAAKWLRYSLEFVREPLGPDVEGLLPRVTALQDHLGWLHDADVAAARARAFLVEHASSLTAAESAAVARYLVSRERELGRLRRTVGPAWRGVAGLSFRRRLGRAVAAL
jgi:CHAD domain-containing protein